MLYLYDRSIVKDLERSFNPDNVADPVVKVVDPEGLLTLAAQIQDDSIKLPVVSVYRDPDTPIDPQRWNFARAHRGVATVIDTETNQIYYEKALPIILSYKLTLLTYNSIDMDELVREILFKYTTQYFLQFRAPYESDRIIRFGVRIDPDQEITRESGSFEYLSSGQLHQTIIPLKIDGAVLLTYTAAKLKRTEIDIKSS